MRLVCMLLLLTAACRPKERPGTVVGTKVLDWNRGPVMLSTGVSIGADVGPSISDRKIVTFTPKGARDSSLGIVRVEVKIDRIAVAIVPNDAGDRPAESGFAPTHIEATVQQNHRWQITSACDAKLNGPSVAKPKGVQFNQNCQILLQSGDDTGEIILSVTGDGSHQIMGSFGTVETL